MADRNQSNLPHGDQGHQQRTQVSHTEIHLSQPGGHAAADHKWEQAKVSWDFPLILNSLTVTFIQGEASSAAHHAADAAAIKANQVGDAAGRKLDQAAEAGRQTVEGVKQQAHQVGQDIKQGAHDLKKDAEHTAHQVGQKVSEKVRLEDERKGKGRTG